MAIQLTLFLNKNPLGNCQIPFPSHIDFLSDSSDCGQQLFFSIKDTVR